MKELSDTLNIMTASGTIREARIYPLAKRRKCAAADDKARDRSQDEMIDDKDARTLAQDDQRDRGSD